MEGFGFERHEAMSDDLKRHIPVIVVVTLVGIASCAFALMQVLNGVATGMDLSTFSTAIIVIPCIGMLLCSFFIAFSAPEISRNLYLIVLGICLVTGFASMFVTSGWMSNADIAAQLVANSPDGTEVVPIFRDTMIMIRDLAAFVVMPTIGCIAGAWVGSRVHPMKTTGKKKTKKK